MRPLSRHGRLPSAPATLLKLPSNPLARAPSTPASWIGFAPFYHDNPRDVHAPEAINAVAELLAESGRDLHDRRSFEAAVGQYEFLRTQYPTSSLRTGALLAEGQIAENDLQDVALARDKYQLLLKSSPHSALAEQAQAGLASLAGRQNAGTSPLAAGASTAASSSRDPRAAASLPNSKSGSGSQGRQGTEPSRRASCWRGTGRTAS